MLLLRPRARALLELSGPDRVRFLQGMVTNDVAKLEPGQGCHAALLTTKGKLLADLVVYAEPDRLLVASELGLRERLLTTFEKHLVMDDVEIGDLTEASPVLGVYGDGAAAALAAASGADAAALTTLAPYHFVVAGGRRIARAPELGPLGYHLIGLVSDAALPGTRLTEAEWQERRIEAGTPLYGVDMTEERLPLEANLTDALSFDKGCYLGQEVIARATNLGHINRRLVGLVIDGEPPPPGTALRAASRPEAGVVTSAARSRRLGQTIALGYVHRTLWDPGTVLATASGVKVTVAPLPFSA